jgi:hypothetical protein
MSPRSLNWQPSPTPPPPPSLYLDTKSIISQQNQSGKCDVCLWTSNRGLARACCTAGCLGSRGVVLTTPPPPWQPVQVSQGDQVVWSLIAAFEHVRFTVNENIAQVSESDRVAFGEAACSSGTLFSQKSKWWGWLRCGDQILGSYWDLLLPCRGSPLGVMYGSVGCTALS